jgi:Trypsin-like peptidase domain
MKSQIPRRLWPTSSLPLVVAAVVVLVASSYTSAKRPTVRVAPEVSVGGVAQKAFVSRQARLLAELTALVPDRALKAPVLAPITPSDRKSLQLPAPNGDGPLRIGVVKPLAGVEVRRGQLDKLGTMVKTATGGFVWTLSVMSADAQAIRVKFENFSLPKNVEMYFFGVGTVVDGPYADTGRNGNGEFWTRSIASEKGIILVRSTGAISDLDRRGLSFVVSAVGHIRGRPPQAVEKSHDSWPCSDNAACVVDVNCVNTGPAAPAENAIAKLEWVSGQFINTCSGGLLADTDGSSQIPYFLTANHCFSSSNSSMETFFFYTTDSCNGACPDGLVSGGTPPPPSTTGVTVVATGAAGDFTLVTLDETPPAGVTYLGWNNAPIASTNGASLYRVSNANFGPQVYSQHDVDTATGTCTGWPRGERIYSADIVGATMGGSSGSPVVNSAGEVVGQLSGCCGFNCGDVCDSASNATVDGALAFYWDSVSQFLDPPAGCTGDAECDDGLFCTGTETCVAGSCQSSGDPCAAGSTCNEATNACDLPACDNDGGCEAGEDCNNCPNDCRAKTGGRPSSRYCCDGDLLDCGNSQCNTNGWVCGPGGGGGGCLIDADCDDGQFCNGAETCAAGSCQAGNNPCAAGETCNEATNACDAGGCSLGLPGDSCVVNGDCCSNKCKGRRGSKTCN